MGQFKSASDLWCRTHADVLNRTIRQVKDPIQTNVRGTAFIAAMALGHIAFEDIPGLVEIEHVYEPNPDHRKLYDDLYREFLNIYKHNKAIYRRLNDRADDAPHRL